jgi:hypothetical protein
MMLPQGLPTKVQTASMPAPPWDTEIHKNQQECSIKGQTRSSQIMTEQETSFNMQTQKQYFILAKRLTWTSQKLVEGT